MNGAWECFSNFNLSPEAAEREREKERAKSNFEAAMKEGLPFLAGLEYSFLSGLKVVRYQAEEMSVFGPD